MNWKVEHWGYSELEAGELENHLNRRAEQGWKLCRVTHSGLKNRSDNWAKYEKSENLKRRYAVDVVAEENEDYILFCEDLGWQMISHLENGLCVFASEEGREKALYVDRQDRFEQAAAFVEEKYGVLHPLVYLVLIIAVIAGLCALINYIGKIAVFPELAVFPVLMGIIILGFSPLRYAVNLMYIGTVRRQREEKRTYGKPLLVNIINYICSWQIQIYGVAAAVYFLWVVPLSFGTALTAVAFAVGIPAVSFVFCGYFGISKAALIYVFGLIIPVVIFFRPF